MASFEKYLTIVVAILLAIVLVLLFFVTRNHAGGFGVTFLDVGQGDATLISFDKKTQMLIDCGSSRKVLAGLGRRMPFYDRTIEYLVVTHPDTDHYVGCIDVLDRYRVEHIWWTARDNKNDPQWEVWKEKMAAEGADVHVVDRAERYDVGDTVLDVLYPDHPVAEEKVGDNNTSIVMHVQHGEFSALLTADAEEELERHLVQEYGGRLRSKVLKIGHHGSNTSSIQEFLDTVAPTIGVISVGKDNKYGHPTPRVLKRLERMGITIRRTDIEGDVVYYP